MEMPCDDTYDNLQKKIGKHLGLLESEMGLEVYHHKGEKLEDFEGPEKLADIFGVTSSELHLDVQLKSAGGKIKARIRCSEGSTCHILVGDQSNFQTYEVTNEYQTFKIANKYAFFVS